MRLRLFVLAAFLAIATNGWGGDKNGAYSGPGAGAVKCAKYLEKQRTDSDLAEVAWVSGYLTAYNRQTPDTYDILGYADLKGVMLWLENWCKTHPLEGLADGMSALTVELHPKRHRTARDAGR